MATQQLHQKLHDEITEANVQIRSFAQLKQHSADVKHQKLQEIINATSNSITKETKDNPLAIES